MKKMSAKKYLQARLELGLTQEQLAQQLGVSSRQISRRETDNSVINKEAEFAIKYLKTIWF